MSRRELVHTSNLLMTGCSNRCQILSGLRINCVLSEVGSLSVTYMTSPLIGSDWWRGLANSVFKDTGNPMKDHQIPEELQS